MRWFVVGCLVWAPVMASAEPTDDGDSGDSGDHAPIENRVNVRFGKSSADTDGRPSVCLDVRVYWRFSVESCGTGQAIIHNDSGQEMMHVRANYSFTDFSLWKGTLHTRGGLGFAEMQVGKDNPGFQFGSPDDDRGSVAGPEAALSAQWLAPLYNKLDFVVTGTVGVAYFAGADELATTKSDVQGFASIEAGIGW